ncbi:MAG: SRPBCC family protein [Actinomycetes bacterium]
MSTIEVSTSINATTDEIWSVVENVGNHIDWMHDAVAIRFTSATTAGVGTTFDCDTKVGPIRLTDKMEITEWVPGKAMGVRHVGMVTGSGVFSLVPSESGHTQFTWNEQLTFPWWMGGPLGAAVGGLVLQRIWRRNLAELKAIVEG